MSETLAFYTSTEVADLLRLNRQVVQRKLQAGEIPAYRIGREWRVERGQLLEWLERHSNRHAQPLTDRWFDKEGRLRALPAQRAKRQAVLSRIAELVPPDRAIPEREVNALLRQVFDDVAFLRRELVGAGLLIRSAGVYRRRSAPRGVDIPGR